MPTVRKRGKSYLLKAYEGYTADGKQIVRTKTWNPPAGMSPAKARKEAMKLVAKDRGVTKRDIYQYLLGKE